MTEDKSTPHSGERKTPYQRMVASSYYGLLGVQPSASTQEIRRAYRDLSKLYHPDTTSLPAAISTSKFQELNEAYATLSNPERRMSYDRKIGYSRVPVVQPLLTLNQPSTPRTQNSSAYLDATDRPLSPGEIFALFILGMTFVACLILAIAIGITRGESALQPPTAQINPALQEHSYKATSQKVPLQAIPTPTPSPDSSASATRKSSPKLTDFLNSSERSHGTSSS